MSNLRHIPVLLFLLFFLAGYSQPKYVTCRYSDLAGQTASKFEVNYIPVPDAYLRSSKVLDTACVMLRYHQLSQLKRYIRTLKKSGASGPDVYLSEALYFITKKNYVEAAYSISQVQNNAFPLLKKLLEIDMRYETSRREGFIDFDAIMKAYQALADTDPSDMVLKKVIDLRVRYARYNY